MPVDLDTRPILVFWETTRACGLACRHCRASAIAEPLPGELTTHEAIDFLETLTGFGLPRPVLVATGGDVLMRHDLNLIAEEAAADRMPFALAPSVTPLLTDERIEALRRHGLKIASISLDGARAATHDSVRGVPGHFEQTLEAILMLRRHGITVQVNTLVMNESVEELPAIARLVRDSGAGIWELFFLIPMGRGTTLVALTPEENEEVCHFLVDASRYGFIVRTVEAPFFRRVVSERAAGSAPPRRALYAQLSAALHSELGEPDGQVRAQTKGTRDGRGIIFVGHDGEVTPSGFLPYRLGNVRDDNIVELYRDHPLLRSIRAAEFSGRCGVCAFRDRCGGSRARAFAATGDPLGEDPACPFEAN